MNSKFYPLIYYLCQIKKDKLSLFTQNNNFSDKIFIFDVLIINIWMKINRIYLYISLLIAIIITSCDDSSQVSKNSSPQIIGLSRQSTYYNDIITVYGKYFGDLS
ncbi:hypothetical protein D9V86_08140, partial [Bacteroidetes/Chlorobi group bacterium ChocPot_Mid]